MIDKPTVFAAIVVGALAGIGAIWCAWTGQLVFGGVLVTISLAVAICLWAYLLHFWRNHHH